MSTRQLQSVKEAPSATDPTDQLLGTKPISRNHEPSRDIVRTARALGFSPKELLELRRLYQATPKGRFK